MSRLADRASWELLTDRLSRVRDHLADLRQAIVTSRRYPGNHDRCGHLRHGRAPPPEGPDRGSIPPRQSWSAKSTQLHLKMTPSRLGREATPRS